MKALWHSFEIEQALNIEIDNQWQVAAVQIDSRRVQKNDLFIALKGARQDGYDFISEAFAKGASAVLAQKRDGKSRPPDERIMDDERVIFVPNSQKALEDLARFARARSRAQIIAITGSVGKTSVKDCLALLLSAHSAEHSFNNHIGVPLSLARLPRDEDFGVFEIGMNHKGEIAPLSRLVQPDMVIITKIAAAHLAFFSSLEDIALAKAEIFSGLKPQGLALLNRDDDFYDLLAKKARAKKAQIISFGSNPSADIKLQQIDFNGETAHIKADFFGRIYQFEFSSLSSALTLNALACLGAAHFLGMDLEHAIDRLAQYQPREGRGNRFKLNLWGKDIIVIDESYNANPESMRACLEALGHIRAQRRIAILGDMFELGKDEVKHHQDLKKPIEAQCDLVFACGDKMKYLYDSLSAERAGFWAQQWQELIKPLEKTLRCGDVVMVKASQAQELSRLIAHLRQIGHLR